MSDEVKCEACNGTGVQVIKHPSEPNKRTIIRCTTCGGRGRIKKADK